MNVSTQVSSAKEQSGLSGSTGAFGDDIKTEKVMALVPAAASAQRPPQVKLSIQIQPVCERHFRFNLFKKNVSLFAPSYTMFD